LAAVELTKNKGGRPTEFPADEIIARTFVWLAENGKIPPNLTGENSLVEKIAFDFGVKMTPAVNDRLADVLRKPYNRAKEIAAPASGKLGFP
jgi:hypothetical protein